MYADELNNHPSKSDSCNHQTKCEICSQEFCTLQSLEVHREQGCEGLIETVSVFFDSKPTIVDCGYEHEIGNDGSDAIDAAIFSSSGKQILENFAPFRKRKKPTINSNRGRTKYVKSSNETVRREANAVNSRSTRAAQHQCKICGRSFSKKSNLTRHHSIHSGETPFECWICHKEFRLKHIMIDHLMNHTFTPEERKLLPKKTFLKAF